MPAATRRELAGVTLLLALLTGALTLPIARVGTRALPGDLGDPLLNAFILGWDASRLPFGLAGVWSAPFYFPLKGTLALSEHLFGVAVFTSPIVWLTGNPVLAYNVAFLGSYVLAGTGMYLLALSLWGRRDAAVLAALAFAFAPHRVLHVSHLQVLMSGWMPVSLWGLHRYFDSGSRRALAVFAGAFALLALSNGYFLYFFAIGVAVVIIGHLVRVRLTAAASWRDVVRRRPVRDLAVALLAVAAGIAPAAIGYVRARQTFGLHRSAGEILAFSAAWSDYLATPSIIWLRSGMLTSGELERMLFPGLTIVVLAALSAVSVSRFAWTDTISRPPGWVWHAGIYAAVLVTAVWLSCGLRLPGPYGVLLRVLPGFDGLRVPARFVVVVALALSVLGSAGAAWLFSRMRRPAATLAAVVLGGAIVAEGYGGWTPAVPFDHGQPARAELNEWLRHGPPGGVVELPIAGPELQLFTLGYQYNSLLHGHPVVNGYSGYGYGLQDFLSGPGSPLRDADALPGVLTALRSIGVRYVLLHRAGFRGQPEFGWPDPDRLVDAMDRATGHAAGRRQFGDTVVWQLDDPPVRLPVDESSLVPIRLAETMLTASAMPDRLRFALDGNLDTKWLSAAPQSGSEWLRVEFGRDVDVGRVAILTSRFGVGDYPRALLVESETGDGSRLALYSGSFLPLLVDGLSRGAAGAPAVLDLPSNRTKALWIRQTGRSRTWQWAVHELMVYERRPFR